MQDDLAGGPRRARFPAQVPGGGGESRGPSSGQPSQGARMHLWVALYAWLPRTGSPAARQAGRAVALLAMADFARNFRVIMLSDFNKIEGRR